MSEFAKLDSLVSTDRLCNLIKYSQLAASRAPGYIAEFGVYGGGSLEVLAKFNPTRDIIAVDSFEGLPAPSEHDYHQEGDFSEVNFRKIYGYFGMMYNNVRIVKGFVPKAWEYFDDNTTFCFAHIDVDIYESVLSALKFFIPRLNRGGIIILDDYKVRSTPGCEIAIRDYFTKHKNIPDGEKVFHSELKFWDHEEAPSHHQYIIVKL